MTDAAAQAEFDVEYARRSAELEAARSARLDDPQAFHDAQVSYSDWRSAIRELDSARSNGHGAFGEEHPELANPIGRAQGRLQAAETYAAEHAAVVSSLQLKVAGARAAVDQAEAQLAEAQALVGVLDDAVGVARSELSKIDGSE